ncbi:MAG: YybS family protein [Syntrophothermus sp.]
MTERMQTKPLVEGALLAAMTVLMAVIDLYLPIPLLSLALPVPIIILVYRHSLNLGIMAAIIAAVLTGILANVIGQTVVVLVFGAVGLALGEAMRQRVSPAKVLVVGTIAALIFGAAMTGLMAWVTGVNDFSAMFKQMEQSLDQAVKFYTGLGVDKAQLEAMRQTFATLMRLTVPIGVLMSALAFATFNYWLSRRILRRLGQATPGFPPFARWRSPRYMVVGFLLSLAFYLVVLTYLRREIYQMVALNILLGFAMAFFLQGLSVVWFFLEKYKVSGIVKALVVFFGVSNNLAALALVSIGVMDGWLNYRRLEDS